jgi:hypothetical protein
VEPDRPDRWRGERMKLWGVLIIALFIVIFILARHALEVRGVGR